MKGEFLVAFMVEVATTEHDSITMTLDGRMPFPPMIGMHITAVEGDDYRKVEEVYWDKAEGLSVWFVFEEREKSAWMEELGWKETP